MAENQTATLLRQPRVIAVIVLLLAAVVLIVMNLRGGPRPDYERDDRTADHLMTLAPSLEMSIKANPDLASLDRIAGLDAGAREDAWGHVIELRVDPPTGREREIRLVSAGADGAMGTADDITAVFRQVWVEEYSEPGLNFVRIERPLRTPPTPADG